MGGEVVDGGKNQGLELEGKGPNGDLKVRVFGSEVKIGSLDRDSEGKGSLASSEAAIDGGEGGAEDREGPMMAENGKGMVLEAEESFRSVDSSFSLEKGRGIDEGLSGSPEGEVVSSVEGDGVMSFEIAGGEKGGDQNVEQGQVDQQSLFDASSSMHESVKHESSGTTGSGSGSAGQITDGVPAVEVNGSTHPEMETCDGVENHGLEVNVEAQTIKNKAGTDYAPETWVSQDTDNGLDMLNNVIELEPYVRTDGKNVSSDRSGKSTSSEPEFHVSDLAWGKVRSHPWWPGQICCPSTASEKAKKYYKKGSYLIAYFWDNTFAWNDAPQIKPYLEHFSQMEKQSNMEEFQDAVACSLDEVSRRVELGLTCSCISRDVYATLNTQIISNAGIREEASRRDGGDRSLVAASFEPEKLIRFIKQSAKFPYNRADRLELVKSRAQLSAFNRLKGYSQLPEYNMLGGLLDDADILLFEQQRHGGVNGNAVQNEDLVQQSKSKNNSSRKRKSISGDSKPARKKEKRLSDTGTEKYLSTPMSDSGSDGKDGSKLILQSSTKKRKAVDAMADGSKVKQLKSDSSTGADNKSHQTKPTFRVGDRISKVASQLNGSSPILKNHNATPKEAAGQDKGEAAVFEEAPPDKMLSQLRSAASNPANGDSFSNSTVSSFSEFRNTVCLEPPNPEDHHMSLKQMFGGKLSKKSASTGNKTISSGITDKSDSEPIPHEEPSLKSQNDDGELVPGAPVDKDTSTSEQKIAGGDHKTDTVHPALCSSETQEEELSPTVLILKFTDMNSVPSKANLNKIFGCYGTLIESETEVLKKSNRVRVVFKKRSDAETAFSSTGKYNTFGPSLVGYSLKFLPSTPSKSSPPS